MNIKIPESFSRGVEGTFGKRGEVFLHALPTLIDEAAARWQLKSLRPAEHFSYHFIVYARREGSEVVLKLGVPDRELTSEIHALRQFAGRGAVRLIDGDSGRGMFLLERLKPGIALATVTDDAEATQIAAYVMLALLRPAPVDTGLLRLEDWFEGFQRFRSQHGGSGPLDAGLFSQAENVAQEIMQEEHRPTLIHGDLHHFNILSSGSSWMAIDPKGVIGPAAYEVGPFLLNPAGEINRRPDAARLMRNRIAILGEILGIDAERIRRCGLTHAVLSAVWSVEEGGDWKPAMEVAGLLAGLSE